jgi:hypothetical protein
MWLQAIGSMKPGDVAIIFTPDDTHFSIATAAIEAGLHVLVAKPIVKTLQEHLQLVQLAKRHSVLVSRWRSIAWRACRACSCCTSGTFRLPSQQNSQALQWHPLHACLVISGKIALLVGGCWGPRSLCTGSVPDLAHMMLFAAARTSGLPPSGL